MVIRGSIDHGPAGGVVELVEDVEVPVEGVVVAAGATTETAREADPVFPAASVAEYLSV